jgi:predicted  nucleic acid-binding Zn-ribbon protein
MAQTSFLSRWTGRPEPDDTPPPAPDRAPQDAPAPPPRRSQLSVWSISPSLERIRQELDEQAGIIQDAKRVLEERLAPFQRHIVEQRRHVDQCLKQLDSRIQPLRQFLEGQGSNLERVHAHLSGELKEQFEDFAGFLAEQRRALERASRYLDEQPRPLAQYLEDEQRAVEHIFQDLEERFEPLGGYLKAQQKLLAAMTEPGVMEEFDLLASYCAERHAALEHYATATEYRLQAFFAELDGIYQKYKAQDGGKSKVLARLLEQTRQADVRLQESMKPLPREQDDPRQPRFDVAT